MRNGQVVIRDIYDVCDALNDLDHNIGLNKSRIGSLNNSVAFLFVGCFAAGYLLFNSFDRLKKKLAAIDISRIREMQDQLDIQEEKILQLELELEDLKKG